jgi:hypothetical protein
MRIHLPEFLGFFESIRAAIRGVLAFEVKVSASLAWSIAVAFDLAPLAFVAGIRVSLGHLVNWQIYHAIEMYLFLFALVCVFPLASVPSFFLFFPLPGPVSAGLSALEDCRWPFMLPDTAIGEIEAIGVSAR